MHIGAEAHVVGEIPSGMVGVFVDDDLVGVPEPAVAEGDVSRSNIPIPAVEPEAAGAAAGETPNMGAAKAAGEVAVGEWLIHMVAGIVGAGVVTDPGLSVIDVRNVGVAGLVAVIAVLGRAGLWRVAGLLELRGVGAHWACGVGLEEAAATWSMGRNYLMSA